MSISLDYHEATKYSVDTIGQHPGLDWTSQPSPYKEFQSSERVELTPHLLLARHPDTQRPILVPRDAIHGPDLPELSTLLLHANGVTAMMEGPEEAVYFRAAPSAGALYPTEIYVAVRDMERLADGIYNYQVRDHSLAPVCEGSYWGDLTHLTFGHPAVRAARCVLLASAVFFRSSWRYHDRAYRRILLDTGHVLGNVSAFAPDLGLAAVPVGGFQDHGINSLLLLDEEQEAMLAVVPIVAGGEARPAAAPPSPRWENPAGGSLITRLHRASYIAEPPPPDPPSGVPYLDTGRTDRIALPDGEIDWGDRLCETILTRRSTRSLTGAAITVDELASLLRYAYADTDRLFDSGRLRSYLVVNAVDGLDPGLYAYDPRRHHVAQLRTGSFSRECHHITLGQELGRDAAVMLIHCADLPATIAHYGDRGYRYLGLDAGHLGQRVNLAAVALDLGVSGIGGYFDDEVNDLFRLAPQDAVIYVTCLGRPARRS